MATQVLIHHTAGCFVCGASVASRNAQAWAHQHANKTGHAVELSLGWRVSCDAPPPTQQEPGA